MRKLKKNRWKTGKIPSKSFYKSWSWLKLRYDTLRFYGAVCMCCGSTHRIVVDHIKSRRRHPRLELDPDNVQVLCDACNRGKSFDDETDFRPVKPIPELDAEQESHLRSIMKEIC
jgi:5-methylcytosine-specific restriction endonuclease McrA